MFNGKQSSYEDEEVSNPKTFHDLKNIKELEVVVYSSYMALQSQPQKCDLLRQQIFQAKKYSFNFIKNN